ncbi:MAG: NADH-quinone oxidoreductase subunit NuoE [Candidatus Marinimicrobia bacterium]|nr:NADH-quinone oxidoreductase subunit NuoE [Candidatus Neomarinimicrobiota bacterium]
MERVQKVFDKYPDAKRDALIPILQDVQEEVGFLSKDAVKEIGNYLKLPTSKIYGVATFYNQFRFEALGNYHIQICRGTACHVKGSAQLLEEFQRELNIMPGETTRDGVFSLEVVACIGACGLAPAITINGKVHAKVQPDEVKDLINKYRQEVKENA